MKAIGRVFRSTDGAASWSEVNAGWTATAFSYGYGRRLALDPTDPSTLYVGTSGGGIHAITFVPETNLNQRVDKRRKLEFRRDPDKTDGVEALGEVVQEERRRQSSGSCSWAPELVRSGMYRQSFRHVRIDETLLGLVAPNLGAVATYANSENAWLSEPHGSTFAFTIRSALADPKNLASKNAKSSS